MPVARVRSGRLWDFFFLFFFPQFSFFFSIFLLSVVCVEGEREREEGGFACGRRDPIELMTGYPGGKNSKEERGKFVFS